jgi:hypothetical protein
LYLKTSLFSTHFLFNPERKPMKHEIVTTCKGCLHGVKDIFEDIYLKWIVSRAVISHKDFDQSRWEHHYENRRDLNTRCGLRKGKKITAIPVTIFAAFCRENLLDPRHLHRHFQSFTARIAPDREPAQCYIIPAEGRWADKSTAKVRGRKRSIIKRIPKSDEPVTTLDQLLAKLEATKAGEGVSHVY